MLLLSFPHKMCCLSLNITKIMQNNERINLQDNSLTTKDFHILHRDFDYPKTTKQFISSLSD